MDFIIQHWQTIAAIAAALVALYQAIAGREYNRVLELAGDIAYELADAADLEKEEKRARAAAELYAHAGPIARKLFTAEQFEWFVDAGWKLIAKPRLKEEGKL